MGRVGDRRLGERSIGLIDALDAVVFEPLLPRDERRPVGDAEAEAVEPGAGLGEGLAAAGVEVGDG